MPLELYAKQVEAHTSKEKEVRWQELEEVQKVVRSHSRCVGKIWNVGENERDRNVVRCHSNLSSYACDPPTLRAVAKTHKPPDKEGCPKSRPIVGACRGLTTPLGEILSDIIEPVSMARETVWESQSTEEVLRKIKEANSALKEGGASRIMVGSLPYH